MSPIPNNVGRIRSKIAAAAMRSGRAAEDVQLIAVSKKMGWRQVQQAVASGQTLFGENYIQEAAKKIDAARKTSSGQTLVWHFLGHLQTNKARTAVELFDVIETVDRFKLALALDRHAATLSKKQSVLIQVNIGAEPQKSGTLPDECEHLLRRVQNECQHLTVLGLMAMPPFSPSPEASRPYFRQLRLLATVLADQGLLGDRGRLELSMGMSADFEIAIEEGSTMVRVGTAIFGPRP